MAGLNTYVAGHADMATVANGNAEAAYSAAIVKLADDMVEDMREWLFVVAGQGTQGMAAGEVLAEIEHTYAGVNDESGVLSWLDSTGLLNVVEGAEVAALLSSWVEPIG